MAKKEAPKPAPQPPRIEKLKESQMPGHRNPPPPPPPKSSDKK
jgi:hypothetical protein